MSSFRLDGKTAIITGGAGGLGRSMVKQYAEAGANVVVASRTLANCETIAGEVNETGGKALAIAVDHTKPAEVDSMVEQVVSHFGSLDVIVNNAGRWGKGGAAEDTALDDWNDIIEQCLTGCFVCCMSAGRQMLKQQSGKIINVSSTAGSKGCLLYTSDAADE